MLPHCRYNENDQPVCRVCNITLKSESQWSAHEVSRKHHEVMLHQPLTGIGSLRIMFLA